MSYMDCCDWSECTRCGECLSRCPVIKMDKAAAGMAMDKLIAGEPVPEVFGNCTFCFNCNSYCPQGLRPHELILDRFMAQRGGVPPMLQYLMNGQPISLFPDLYAQLKSDEQQILEQWSVAPGPVREALFIGCVGRLNCYDIENSAVLKSLPKFAPSDLCCGELAYRLGTWQSYADTIEKTLRRFEELELERLVCYCGSCYNYFSNILPNVYGQTLPFEVVSLYEWLWEKVEVGELTCKAPLNLQAAVHESCYVSELGEGFGATLRKLYGSVGLDCVELEHRGCDNLSCGAVSTLRSLNLPRTLLKEQNRKYREVSSSGTDNIALNCPGCFITMGFTSFAHGKQLHYMPEQILLAFGDHQERPLKSRLPLIVKTFMRRLPRLLAQRPQAELPRIGA